ncbi:bifunctional diaminohydroxyphosphoribosylaminopyrimidine deaminase/5-amino-6-(5-phosphoribosylamino)uracil reductase RibD [Oenococcus sp. UCMA 17063]|nr:bifunctional diaminohydroxyphosphoribosylaminopyrimidine deaminase/5-amino-6-(5-phosphoribosylamino)uracil reductase RibD [Oenococcus sp. UCMA 17063]
MKNKNRFMDLAFLEAKKGHGNTWTNPQVGAVIVKNEQVLATGYHHRFGEPHAEIDALNNLADIKQAIGATMYVTLEPCSHYGKTPPCAKKIIEVGIKKVVIGQQDPNPLVSGKGINMLKAKNIDVTVLKQTSGDLNEFYNFFYQHHRPFVTLKYAMSLDGKINQAKKERTILTGQAAYLDSQHLRADRQAILIGENTLKIDNPALTVRKKQLEFPPIRILLVRNIEQLDFKLKVFNSDTPIWILTTLKSERKAPENVKLFFDDFWTPDRIINFLSAHGIQSLLVEGGSKIQAAFVKQKLVDQLVVYLSPKIIGGQGLPAVYGQGLSETLDFSKVKMVQLGNDLRISARRF